MKTKKILLIIVLSLFTDIVIAQENNYTAMLKVGKVWNYDLAYMEIPEGGGDAISKHTDYKIWIDGDSILDGKSFFKIRRLLIRNRLGFQMFLLDIARQFQLFR